MTGPTTADLLEDLRWRGLLYQTTEGLAEHLAAGPVRAYCGFDPTAASLHVGNLLPIMGLVRLQEHGHRPVALVGGGTGLIGDPSGKTAERQLNARETIAANTAAIRAQLERLLDFEGPAAAAVADNAEWLGAMGAIDLLRDVGKHFSVNVMLAKESVRGRMETGISFTEFSYMLLQSYDFVELRRRLGVTVQVGGSDQWGNITAGTELVRRMDGAHAHGLTFPLLTTSSGQKFGKTEAGAVWLDAERTSPYQFFQFWMHAADADVGRLLRFYTLMPRDEIDELDRATAERPARREAQHALAYDVTGACTAPRRRAWPSSSPSCCSPRATRTGCRRRPWGRCRRRCRWPRSRGRPRGSRRSTPSSCSSPPGWRRARARRGGCSSRAG
jgi:tyrosyl-tRNA synthetase